LTSALIGEGDKGAKRQMTIEVFASALPVRCVRVG
jgi:hypothetical protein